MLSWVKELSDILLTEILQGNKLLYNEPMKNHTTFKIGGVADILALPETQDEIISLLRYAKEENVPCFVMGNGSNLLVSDKGIRGLVIKLFKNYSKISVNGDVITAQSGALLSKVSSEAAKNSLTGLEFASGIPGTLGGAVYMNAGAYGGEMRDVVLETTYIDKDLEIKKLTEHSFSYRHSIFQENGGIIISSVMKLKKGNADEINDKIRELSLQRTAKQPVEMPSAGSAFKRPEGYFAAKLIDDCGLRGFKIGGAAVSSKHTGFVVNEGGATAGDVKKLLSEVQRIVYDKTGVTLQPEIKFIGED